MRERLGSLRRHLNVLEDTAHRGVLGNEGDGLHFAAAEGAQPRVDLVDLLDEGGPGETGAAAEGFGLGDGQGGGDAGGGGELIAVLGGDNKASCCGAAFAA